jgi:hypothetical protein
MGRPAIPGLWPFELITRRSQVQILPRYDEVAGQRPFPNGRGPLALALCSQPRPGNASKPASRRDALGRLSMTAKPMTAIAG